MPHRKAGGTGETVRTVAAAVFVALLVRTVAFEPFNIPSGSMIPNLLVGDYLFVSKYSYGYSRFSMPLSPPFFSGRMLFSEPKRGDIAVFKYPRDVSVDYIKRIIGLPGDRIQVRGGRLYINGTMMMRERVEDYVYIDTEGHIMRSARYIETLPNGTHYPILEAGDAARYDDTPEYVVPEGHYFMMGDNRDRSADSRTVDVGFVPSENLVGRAEILFFSTNGTARFWEFWKWPVATRWGRLFRDLRASSSGDDVS
ncbi:signal peptidase I [Haematospirillum sp. H1815]|uniref:signal peptidase I n=1 Tax=Haematospirillum sp. H1815 TaxID=2723108 RepID=UPI001439993B|nr:signal peptidase I [Haematospirillum sp. H1815]NKD76376.1 signal peptidase I [Haematospirillum sp. H1815]